MFKFTTFLIVSILIIQTINGIIIKGGITDNSSSGISSTLGIMPWMGLERTQENITSDLAQIEEIHSLFKSVSFERFNLGPNSQLVINNFTDVQSRLERLGLSTIPMISTCCPWGRPEVIQYARELISNPKPFIDSAIELALNEGFDGYNLDIEPLGGNPTDAVNYANFLNQFANALHKINKVLTVDVAGYDQFWNFTLIGQTSVDYVITMSTYASNFTSFTKAFNYALANIPIEKLVIGLMTVDSNGVPYTDQMVQQRFQLLSQNNIRNIAIWEAPIPDNWIPYLKDFVVSSNQY
eukprot:gene844-1051_t